MKENRVLVTGAAGFLGSHIACRLAGAGIPVTVIARSGSNGSAAERVAAVFRWLGLSEELIASIPVVEGDLSLRHFGLAESGYDALCSSVSSIIHAAAETSFLEKRRTEIDASNIRSIANLEEFIEDAGITHLHHISTAFVSGTGSAPVPEELIEPGGFNNYYEETKNLGEHELTRFCAEKAVRLTICRPSIVYGNSITGKTFRFNALYYPVKIIGRMRNRFLGDISAGNTAACSALGVSHTHGKSLHMPISLHAPGGARLNIIPVDYFMEVFYRIYNSRETGIFNIVNPDPPGLDRAVEFIMRYYSLSGLSVDDTTGKEPQRSALEILFDGYIGVYTPYLRSNTRYACANTMRLIDGAALPSPEFDFKRFSTVIGYAEQNSWGRDFKF